MEVRTTKHDELTSGRLPNRVSSSPVTPIGYSTMKKVYLKHLFELMAKMGLPALHIFKH